MTTSVVYNLGVLTHIAPWGIFGLGGIDTFWDQKIRQEKLPQFMKILNYNKSFCNFFGQTLLIFPIYIWVKHFDLEMSLIYGYWHILSSKIRQEKFWTISSVYVLNCFKYFLMYILGQNVSKNQTRKILHYIKLFQIVLNIYFGIKCLKKSDKISLALYQVSTYNFLCQNDKTFMKIFGLYLVFDKMSWYSQFLCY